MHNILPTIFLFIDNYEKEYIRKLDKKIAIIYRKYSSKYDKKIIINIKMICKKSGRKLFLANNLKLANTLDLDGVYLPSFNESQNINKTNIKKPQKFSPLRFSKFNFIFVFCF